MQKVVPDPSPLARPYFDGCRKGQLLLQRCQSCDTAQFYPRVVCSHCGASTLQWTPASGRGFVASFTIVRRAVSQAYDAPYVLALIDLAEGPRMMSQVIYVDIDTMTVGIEVSVASEAWSDETDMPVFRPV